MQLKFSFLLNNSTKGRASDEILNEALSFGMQDRIWSQTITGHADGKNIMDDQDTAEGGVQGVWVQI